LEKIGGCLKNNFRYLNALPVFSILILFICSINGFAQDSATCLECHDDVAATLMNTPHELRQASEASASIGVGCVDCHKGWQEHINDPNRDNIEKPSELSLTEQGEVCGSCHLTTHQSAMVTTDPHMKADLSCTSCHSVHGNRNNYLVKEDLNNFCVSCHEATAAEFSRRSAHPIESGNIRCVDCHDLSTITNREFNVGFDWTCQSCHEDKAGPFPYEHPVVYSHLVEGGTCMECHEPHGSVNDRLLKQTGRALCLQCHSVPQGHQVMHSGLGSKYDCVQCHDEIHGSFSNRILLDPDLGDKMFLDCFQSGCHSLGNYGG
jgi:DmsE family decaheme c-type cytochrome